jgi:LPXTG-motif cell wall-anchored protein
MNRIRPLVIAALLATIGAVCLWAGTASATAAPTVSIDGDCQGVTITATNVDATHPVAVRLDGGAPTVLQPGQAKVWVVPAGWGTHTVQWAFSAQHTGQNKVTHRQPPECTPDTTTPPVDTTAPVTTPPPADSSVPPTPSSPPVASTEPAQPVPTGSGSVQPSRKGTLPATGSDWTLALIGSGMLAAGALSMFGVKRWAR